MSRKNIIRSLHWNTKFNWSDFISVSFSLTSISLCMSVSQSNVTRNFFSHLQKLSKLLIWISQDTHMQTKFRCYVIVCYESFDFRHTIKRKVTIHNLRLHACWFDCLFVINFFLFLFIALFGSLQMCPLCRCTGVREFTVVSMLTEIYEEDVLFLAKIRILWSNLDR